MHSRHNLRKREITLRIGRTARALARTCALGALALGCSLAGDATRPRDIERTSEVSYQEVEAGLEGTVRIDSLTWVPLLPFPLANGSFEVPGAFAAVFRNEGSQPVHVRYDLRFFDEEDALVDAFIPFGQPVALSPGERRAVQGEFLVRTSDIYQSEHLALMRLVARVRHPEE